MNWWDMAAVIGVVWCCMCWTISAYRAIPAALGVLFKRESKLSDYVLATVFIAVIITISPLIVTITAPWWWDRCTEGTGE